MDPHEDDLAGAGGRALTGRSRQVAGRQRAAQELAVEVGAAGEDVGRLARAGEVLQVRQVAAVVGGLSAW